MFTRSLCERFRAYLVIALMIVALSFGAYDVGTTDIYTLETTTFSAGGVQVVDEMNMGFYAYINSDGMTLALEDYDTMDAFPEADLSEFFHGLINQAYQAYDYGGNPAGMEFIETAVSEIADGTDTVTIQVGTGDYNVQSIFSNLNEDYDGDGIVNFADSDYSYNSVPEPATLFIFGAGGLAFFRRRKYRLS